MAIYKPTNFNPYNVAVDLSSPVEFSCVVQGTVEKYRLYILDLIANTTVYDSGEVTLGDTLYNDEILKVEVPADPDFIGKTRLKYYYDLTSSNGETLKSKEVLFYNYESPVFDLNIPNPLTSRGYTLNPTFTQADGLLPAQHKYIFYNDGDVVLDSGWIYSSDLTYNLDFFLNGETYTAVAEVFIKETNTYYTTEIEFDVEYSTSSIAFAPQAFTNSNEAHINLSWASAQYVEGNSTGSISYIPSYQIAGNTGLRINDASSFVQWQNGSTDEEFLISAIVQFPASFVSGEFMEFQNSSDSKTLLVGYSGNRFYLKQDDNFFYERGTVSIIADTPYLIQITSNAIVANRLEVNVV